MGNKSFLYKTPESHVVATHKNIYKQSFKKWLEENTYHYKS